MKRVLSIALVLLMLLALLAGCKDSKNNDGNKTNDDQTSTVNADQQFVDKAADMVNSFYNPIKTHGETVSADFSLPTEVIYEQQKVQIEWSVVSGQDLVKLEPDPEKKLTKVKIDNTKEGGEIKLKGVVSFGGFTHDLEFTYTIVSQMSVLNKAYELKPGESLGSSSTLTGKIISIDTAYDAGFGNITITFVVLNQTDKPVKCYRLKNGPGLAGQGVELIKVGDTITVFGSIKNYQGTIEFDTGCQLMSIDEAAVLTDAEKVEFELSKLSLPVFVGEAQTIDLPQTGKAYPEVALTWTSSDDTLAKIENGKLHLNIPTELTEITVKAEGKCGGASASKEFKIKLKNGEMSAGEILEALYALAEGAALDGTYKLSGTIKSVDTAYDAGYQNVTVTIVVDGYPDKPVKCYRMKGDGADTIKVGDKITVEGALKNYKGTREFDANCVLVSVDEVAEMTDAQKIEAELAKLSFDTSVSTETTVDLPVTGATYSEVTFRYSTSDSVLAAISGDKLTLKIGTDNVTVTVTVVATCGEATSTKEYKILLLAKELTAEDIVNMAYALDKDTALEGTYTLTGKITSVDEAYNAQYGNITITFQIGSMSDKLIKCYRLKNGSGIEEGKGVEVIKVGDTITVTGKLKNYKGTVEFDSGCTLDKIDEAATLTDAEKAAFELSKLSLPASVDKETTVDVPKTGAAYPEVTFTWASDSALVTVSDGKLTLKPGAENTDVTVTVTAKCGSATEQKEFKVAVLAKPLTQEDIVNMAYALEKDTALDGTFTLTGKITAVNTAYDAGFKNVTVTIQVGTLADKPIQCFRMKNGSGIEAGKGVEIIKAGDTVTVSGVLKNYKGTVEFDANCTLDRIDAVATLTDAEKAAFELSKLTLPASVEEETALTLLTKGVTYTDVTFSWSSDNALATVSGSQLTLKLGTENVTVTVTATAKCGSATEQKEFKISLIAKPLTQEDIVNMAYALDKDTELDGTYTLTGKITAVNTAYDAGFKNVTVTIQVGTLADKLIQCFRMKNGTTVEEGKGVEVIKVGDTITVTGKLKNYKGTVEFDANCTLDKIDAVATMTDEQKVDAELAALTLPASFDKAASVDLASKGATYETVAITWTSDNALAKVENGKLNVTIGAENATVKVTATAKCGSVTKTKEFTISILAKELTQEDIVNMAYALEKDTALDGTYTLTGRITAVNTAYDAGFKNVTVTIQVGTLADKPIQCFRMKNGTGVAEGQGVEVIKVGDTITVTGKLKNYKGTVEFDANCTLDSFTAGEMTDAEKAAAELAALTLPSSVNKETTVDLPAKGTTYTAVTITWATSNNTLAAISGGKLTLKPGTENATVTVTATATCGSATETKEYKISLVATAMSDEEIVNTAYETLKKDGDKLDGTHTLTGKITSVDTAYSTQFKNVTVTIVVGSLTDKPVQCFRLKNGTGITEGQGVEILKVGDTITVTGTIKNYQGKIEFDANCTLDSFTAGEATDEQKVDAELAALTLPASFDKAASVDLASKGATYEAVAITWTSDNALAKVENGKLVITIGAENTTVKVTATATCGSATKTKEFTVQILAKELTQEDIVNMAYEKLKANNDKLDGTYTLTGVITEAKDFSTQYNNRDVTIVVGTLTDKPVLCWRLVNGTGTTLEDVKALKVGDTITVTGSLKYYNGVEFDQGCTLDSFTATELTDAQKIAAELATLTLPSAVTAERTIDLPVKGTTYETVLFDWTTSDDVYAAIDGDKLTLKIPAETKTVTVSVRAESGTEFEMKDFEITLKVSSGEAITDTLTGSVTYGEAATIYKEWTYEAESGTVYFGQTAGKDGSIQLRSTNSNSGIVVTTSVGKVQSVTITFVAETDDARIVDVYGKNEAYTAPSDLYDSAKQGTKLGSIAKNDPQTLTISGDYGFIGLRSNKGALYIESIVIVWAD